MQTLGLSLVTSYQTSRVTRHIVWFLGHGQELAHLLLWCPCCHLHDGPGDSKLLNDAWHAKNCSLSANALVLHTFATAAPAQSGQARAPAAVMHSQQTLCGQSR